jgi:hypothetical protein
MAEFPLKAARVLFITEPPGKGLSRSHFAHSSRPMSAVAMMPSFYLRGNPPFAIEADAARLLEQIQW